MKKVSLFLCVFLFSFVASSQEIRKNTKNVNCNIVGKGKKIINSYQTDYITAFRMGADTLLLEVIVNNNGGRIARIIVRYEKTNLFYLYTSLSDNMVTDGAEIVSHNYEEVIEDEEDGTIVSTNSQYSSGVKIAKMDTSYYKLLRLSVTTKAGDIETTNYTYTTPVVKKTQPKKTAQVKSDSKPLTDEELRRKLRVPPYQNGKDTAKKR